MINRRPGGAHLYHQAVAATGRLASSDPNLQNIGAQRTGGAASGRPSFCAPVTNWWRRTTPRSSCASWRIRDDKGLLDRLPRGDATSTDHRRRHLWLPIRSPATCAAVRQGGQPVLIYGMSAPSVWPNGPVSSATPRRVHRNSTFARYPAGLGTCSDAPGRGAQVIIREPCSVAASISPTSSPVAAYRARCRTGRNPTHLNRGTAGSDQSSP